MSDIAEIPFLKFLADGNSKGGFETDDVLAALLPLMKQTKAAHDAGMVAPLDGLNELFISEQGSLAFASEKQRPPKKNASKLEALQTPVNRALDVVGETRRTTDIDASSLTISDLAIGSADAITKPVYLPNYISWEHALGHHDELTDIFSLGMLLASVACGLDFTDREDLEIFTINR
ncbi:MAG TPA: DNA helicase, partial [Candidatus Dormibacteraeota bacterium]|nr:DNA helicase [Candidatus Dormibacteraeota bacterium]